MGQKLLQHLPYSPDLAPSNFHLFGPQGKSFGKFKNYEDFLQHRVWKFLQMPIKNLMLRVPADLQNNGNTTVNCRENMLKSNTTVRNVRFTVVVLRMQSWNLLNAPRTHPCESALTVFMFFQLVYINCFQCCLSVVRQSVQIYCYISDFYMRLFIRCQYFMTLVFQ